MDPDWVDVFPIKNGNIPAIAMWSFTRGYMDAFNCLFFLQALSDDLLYWLGRDFCCVKRAPKDVGDPNFSGELY